jgi:hypothetical protein
LPNLRIFREKIISGLLPRNLLNLAQFLLLAGAFLEEVATSRTRLRQLFVYRATRRSLKFLMS